MFAALAFANLAHASRLSYVSDLISTSAPGFRATHTLTFTIAQAVPASGSIVVTPESAFILPGAFDYTDMTLSVNAASSTLAAAASPTADGVAIVSGASSAITVTLNSTSGLSAGNLITITLASTTDASMDAINPATVGSYRIRIRTRDASGATIDDGTAMIAIVPQVGVTAGVVQVEPILTNGLPSGTVAANNPNIEISFNSNELATCRYATSSGISYAAMTNSFLPTIAQSFYVDLTGFKNNTTYTYYVRCISTQGLANSSDYVISFTLAPDPISNTSISQGGSSGHGGQGNYPGGSSVLYLGSVSFAGLSPQGAITVLTDGGNSFSAIAGAGGAFTASVTGLERGLYTFAMFATDSYGLKTAPYSATLNVQQGTSNAISGIALPPTIALQTTVVDVAAPAHVYGSAISGSSIEIDVSSLSNTGVEGAPHIYYASSTDSGAWKTDIPGVDLAQGTYTVKARSIVSANLSSDFGQTLYLGVGGAPLGSCSNTKGDLNGDGKVNLIDFSIQLTSWGKSGSGDLNCDGVVNLADFSILLYNWTG